MKSFKINEITFQLIEGTSNEAGHKAVQNYYPALLAPLKRKLS